MRGQPVLADPSAVAPGRRRRADPGTATGRRRCPSRRRPTPPPPAAVRTGAPAGSSSSCSCCWRCSAACIVAFAYATDLLGKDETVDGARTSSEQTTRSGRSPSCARPASWSTTAPARRATRVAEDAVISQDPAAGTELAEGRPRRDRHQQRTAGGRADPAARRHRSGRGGERGRVPARPRLHEREHPATASFSDDIAQGAVLRTEPPGRRRRRPPSRDDHHHPASCPRAKNPATTTTTAPTTDATPATTESTTTTHRRRPWPATAGTARADPWVSAAGGRHPVEEGLQHRRGRRR